MVTTREAQQPADLAAERGIQQPQRPGGAAEHVVLASTGSGRGSSRLPVHAAEAVVFEDQREDAVVARPRDPGARARRGQFHQRRPRTAHEHHRDTAGEQLAERVQPAPGCRGDPHPGGGDPRDDGQGDPHLGLEAEPDAHAGQDQPAGAPALEAADGTPHRRHAAQHEQGVGVVVARDRDRHRRQRQREAGDEASEAAEAATHEVVHERHRRDPHQRLRNQQAHGVIAEHPHRQRLDPQGQRRLVHRHHPGTVEGRVQEVVPARAHRPHGGAVVGVRPAVAAQVPEVQEGGQAEQCPQLGAADPHGDRPGALAQPPRAAHAHRCGGGGA